MFSDEKLEIQSCAKITENNTFKFLGFGIYLKSNNKYLGLYKSLFDEKRIGTGVSLRIPISIIKNIENISKFITMSNFLFQHSTTEFKARETMFKITNISHSQNVFKNVCLKWNMIYFCFIENNRYSRRMMPVDTFFQMFTLFGPEIKQKSIPDFVNQQALKFIKSNSKINTSNHSFLM